MAEDEKTKKRNETKIKKRDYTGYDDEEFAPGQQAGVRRSILSKYDEELEGSGETVRVFATLVVYHGLIVFSGLPPGWCCSFKRPKCPQSRRAKCRCREQVLVIY